MRAPALFNSENRCRGEMSRWRRGCFPSTEREGLFPLSLFLFPGWPMMRSVAHVLLPFLSHPPCPPPHSHHGDGLLNSSVPWAGG